MVFDPKLGNHSPFMIDSEPIRQVSSYKYLCLFIDNNLFWDVYVDKLCQKIAKKQLPSDLIWTIVHTAMKLVDLGVYSPFSLYLTELYSNRQGNSDSGHFSWALSRIRTTSISQPQGLDATAITISLFLRLQFDWTLVWRTWLCDCYWCVYLVIASYVLPKTNFP